LVQRNAEELSSYQKKIIAIDSHFGAALAGLASDARVLSNFMKQQALGSRLTYARAIPLSEIVSRIGDRAQTNTQMYGKRPYGVGLLIAGVDARGPHLYEFQPSGVTQEMIACGIGAESGVFCRLQQRGACQTCVAGIEGKHEPGQGIDS